MRSRPPVASLLAALAIVSFADTAFADAPPLLPVQGTLYDVMGEPIHDSLSVEFTLYSDPAGTAPLWSDVMIVQFTDGVFTAYLGEGDPINHVIFRDYAQVFVGISVDGDEEMPLFGLATAPYAGYAAYCGDASTLGEQTAEDIVNDALISARDEFAPLGHRTAWASIDGIPGGFSDGVDDDTVLSESEVDAYVANNGFISGVLGSTGLLGGGTSGDVTLSIDPSWAQRRVVGACPDGQSIRRINEDGSVDCQLDTVGAGDITDVFAGTGLAGGSTNGSATVTIDSSYTQRRVAAVCPAGSAMRAIYEDGTILCEPINRITCTRSGWVYGDQGCSDDMFITCTDGYVTNIRFNC